MWGHRKIAWLARHEHGVTVAEATCLRILREEGLVLPVDYVRERRDLAGARREAFVEMSTRRNRVWQMDFERHEALCDRAVMKGHRGLSVVAGG